MKSSVPISHDDSHLGGFRAKASALDLNTATVFAQLVQLDEVTGTEPEGPGLLWPVITHHLWLWGDAEGLGQKDMVLSLTLAKSKVQRMGSKVLFASEWWKHHVLEKGWQLALT